MSQTEQLLHEGPDNCVEEWLSYFHSHKREVVRSAWELLPKNHRYENKVFCLNAGGCGSKYLIHLLKANKIDRCYHEKAPDLDRSGVQYFLSGKYEWVIKGLLLLTRNRVYLESSNRLFSLAPLLKSVFPNSKFIHLHRNGIDSVRSNVNKTLWPDVMQCATRLRYASHLAGNPALSPFERTCHYWANINERISEDLDDMQDDDVFSLTFDDLIQGRLDDLESFLGHPLSVKSIEPVNTKADLKAESEKVVEGLNDWPAEWRRSFVKICGPIQSKLGYCVPEVREDSTAI